MNDQSGDLTPDEGVTVWRLRHARGNSNASGGEWDYFEDFDRLYDTLLRLACEAEVFQRDTRDQRRRSHFRWWWKRDNDEGASNDWHCQRIVAVEQLVGGAWVELAWRIDPPVLTLTPYIDGAGS